MDFKIEFSRLLKQLRMQTGFEFMDKQLKESELVQYIKQLDLTP